MGIRGNSHMLMQDTNNLQLADLILGWIDKHAFEDKNGSRALNAGKSPRILFESGNVYALRAASVRSV